MVTGVVVTLRERQCIVCYIYIHLRVYINKRAIFRGREHVHTHIYILYTTMTNTRGGIYCFYAPPCWPTSMYTIIYICIYIVVAYVETHKGRTVYDDYAIRPMSASRTIIFFLLKRISLSPSTPDVYMYDMIYTYIYQFVRTYQYPAEHYITSDFILGSFYVYNRKTQNFNQYKILCSML